MPLIVETFDAFLCRAREAWGSTLDLGHLDASSQFKPAFRTGRRVTVQLRSTGGTIIDVKSGYVGVTTGWRPAFILLLTKRSKSSHILLGANDRLIIKEKTR